MQSILCLAAAQSYVQPSPPLLWSDTDACWILPVSLAEVLSGSVAADRAWWELLGQAVNGTRAPKGVFNIRAGVACE